MSSRLPMCPQGLPFSAIPPVCLLPVLLLLATCGCGNEADSSAVLAQKVYMHENRGEYEQAIEAISLLIEREPDNPVLYYDRGVFHEALGKSDEAFADYSQAIEKAPGHALALNNRAAILARQGDLEGAVQDFGAAIEHNPEHALAYRNRGEAYLDLAQTELALKDLQQAQSIEASDPLVHFLLGRVHHAEDRPYAALEELAVALHLDPQYEPARDLRKELYSQLGVEIADPAQPLAPGEPELAPLPQAAE